MGYVSYQKMTKNTIVKVAFIMGKAKVVPIDTTLSIPRLELIAATLGAKMHCHIKSSLQLPLRNCYLYTD